MFNFRLYASSKINRINSVDQDAEWLDEDEFEDDTSFQEEDEHDDVWNAEDNGE